MAVYTTPPTHPRKNRPHAARVVARGGGGESRPTPPARRPERRSAPAKRAERSERGGAVWARARSPRQRRVSGATTQADARRHAAKDREPRSGGGFSGVAA